MYGVEARESSFASFGIEGSPRGSHSIKYAEAIRKLWMFIACSLLVIVALLVMLITGLTCNCSPDSGIWVYRDDIVSKELDRLKQGPTYNYKSHVWFGETQSSEDAPPPDANTPVSDYEGPTVYRWNEYKPADYPNPDLLPFTDIRDNTESIAAYDDIMNMVNVGAVLLDIGGGRFDTAKKWVEKQKQVTMFVADPFNRPEDHNVDVQREVESRGGADVVTSMSVLNVIEGLGPQTRHVWLVFSALKPGGLAIFKIWAGTWPLRGTRVDQVDKKSLVGDSNPYYQTNAFADAFKPLIEKVFGKDNVFADANLNALVARKA